MDKHPFPKKLLTSPWVLTSIALLALALVWRLGGDQGEVRHRPSKRESPPKYQRSGYTTPRTGDPAPGVPEAETPDALEPEAPVDDVATPIETGGMPEELAEVAPPLVDQPVLPPCPQPLERLRAAWLKRDWSTVHAVLQPLLERKDCSHGTWLGLKWASQEAGELMRRKSSMTGNPNSGARSLYQALLTALDAPQSLREVTLEVVDVSPNDGNGYTVVEGVDRETKETLLVLTRQSVEIGGLFSPFVIADGQDGSRVVDLTLYAPVIDRAIFDRLRKDPEALAKLPSDMQAGIEALDEFDGMTRSAKLRDAREGFRQEAIDYLAMTERIAPDIAAKYQVLQQQLNKSEDHLYHVMGEFFILEK